jgi:hypothetical protein
MRRSQVRILLGAPTKTDPLDLRLRNYAEVNPADGRPWSSKKLREAYAEGARLFGWRERAPRVAARRRVAGGHWHGQLHHGPIEPGRPIGIPPGIRGHRVEAIHAVASTAPVKVARFAAGDWWPCRSMSHS